MATLKEQLAAANQANNLQRKEIERLLDIIKNQVSTLQNLHIYIAEIEKLNNIADSKLEAASLLVTTLRETQVEILADKKYYYEETKDLNNSLTWHKLRILDLETTINIVDRLTQ